MAAQVPHPPLNVLITDPHLKGGGQVRYLTNLAIALGAAGHRVTIGCKPGSVLVERAAEAGCSVVDEFPFRGGLRPRAWWQDVSRMIRFIQEEKPDIIHVNGSQDHWTAALALGRLKRPVCLLRTRHNTYTVANHGPNRILNHDWTDYQICVCDWVRRQLAEQSAFDAARMCAIHNGVDADEYRPDAEARRDVRAEFGYGVDETVCGISARLVEDKGHRYLFEAIALLAPSYPNLRLLVLGEGKEKESLTRHITALGLQDITIFTGFRLDMARCVQAFDIGIQPSIDCDTSSFSLKEEMAAGKAVVASDHGGLPEIVRDGVDGYIVPAGTVEPLAEAIKRLIDNPEQRDEMGAAGREHVLKEFSIQIFGERTAQAYRDAIEVHRERTAS